MKKYKDRHLRKISHVIGVAYLIIAILWGVSTFHFTKQREALKENFDSGEIELDEFLEESMKFSEKEEKMFGLLYCSLAVNTISDFALYFGTKGKDL